MLTFAELDELLVAKRLLENEGLAMRLQNIMGKPISQGISWLPDKVRSKINDAA